MLPRWLCIFMICMGLALLGGCAALQGAADFLLGQQTDAEGNPVGDADGGPAAMLAGMFGFGNVVQGLAGLYSRVRRRKYLKAGMTLTRGIQKAIIHIETNGGTINKDTLIKILRDEQDKQGVKDVIKDEMRLPAANGVPKLKLVS